MASVARRFASFQSELYRVAEIDDKSITNVQSATVSANKVGDVENIGDLVESIAEIELALYDEDYVIKVAGQANQENLNIEVKMDFGDANHNAIRNSGTDEFTWIIRLRSGTNAITYLVVDGWVNNKTYGQPQDGVAMFSFDVVRSGELFVLEA